MMECEIESKYFSSNPSLSQPSPPSTPPPVTSASNPTSICFSCKRPGHWARECPDKSPKKSPSSSPGSGPSAVDGADCPLLRCPCGWGISYVRISNTQKNPGRRFYSCPGGKPPMGCRFFKWYEEFAHLKAPMCPCGAGACILNFDSGEQRWYFSCRIKKNQGACGFIQWAESEDCQAKTEMNGTVMHESPVNPSLSSDSPVIRDPEIAPDFSAAIVNSMEDGVPHGELANQEVDSWDFMQKALRLPDLLPQSYIRCTQTEFSLEISVADVTQQVLGIQVHGWLGRLVFPPGQCLKDPHVPSVPCKRFPNYVLVIFTLKAWIGTFVFFCLASYYLIVCVFPTFDPITLEDPSNIESPTPVIASSNDDAPPPPVPPALQICGENPHILDPFISRLILKSFGQGLLDVLQSMSPSDHETMQIVAEATFDALQRLSFDHGPFSNWVKEYICCMSKLSGIEGSMRGDVSSEELIDLFGDKKARFDCVSHLHTEAVVAYKAAEGRLKSLREEVSRLRELLLHIETESALCEVEASELQSCVVETSKDKSESEMIMEAAYHEMEKALNLEHERDSVLDAAKVALENAKNELLQQ